MSILGKISEKQTTALIFLFAFVVQLSQPYDHQNASGACRMAMIDSLAERGTFIIDESHQFNQNIDKAQVDGHLYCEKAPAVSIIALPLYLFLKAAGSGFQQNEQLAGHILAISTSVLFTALTLALLYVALSETRLKRGEKIILSVCFGIGTVMFSHNTELFGHHVGAFFSLAAYWFVRNPKKCGYLDCVYAGTAAGIAMLAEYPAALTALIIAAYLTFWQKNAKKPALFLAAFGVFFATSLFYNFATTGSPFEYLYQYVSDWSGSPWKYELKKDLAGIILQHVENAPQALERTIQVFFDQKEGLISTSPILLLGLAGLFGKKRKKTLLMLAPLAFFILFYTTREIPHYLGRFYIAAFPLIAIAAADGLEDKKPVYRKTLLVLLAIPSVSFYFFNNPLHVEYLSLVYRLVKT